MVDLKGKPVKGFSFRKYSYVNHNRVLCSEARDVLLGLNILETRRMS